MVEFLLSITDNGPQKVLQLFDKRDLINNTKIKKEFIARIKLYLQVCLIKYCFIFYKLEDLGRSFHC